MASQRANRHQRRPSQSVFALPDDLSAPPLDICGGDQQGKPALPPPPAAPPSAPPGQVNQPPFVKASPAENKPKASHAVLQE
nr:hypothetical protein CDL12_16206 [Ipomoea trifida]GMC91823.1 hypothetical protein CDL12_16206 [Ipomoea batatas]GMC93674.1 hypothetical protein CDL12_16206 [Ipomoea batatas]GMC97522.1 hypothetical protein CDL12_16206 [Ipomoea batatas]GME10304.1 hypothetical protein CDL12_16206 [Ipomoea batatas]